MGIWTHSELIMIEDATTAQSSDRTHSPLVRQVSDLLAVRFTEPWTVGRIAASVNRDRAYLSRVFKRHTGVTVHRFLVLLRLRHAEGLIRGGEKIEAAALLAGFRSRRTFYQAFKTLHGVTPAAFRHQSR